MEWTTPQHEVIDLNCEVSSYANAELYFLNANKGPRLSRGRWVSAMELRML